ncbi:thioredoxin family protein [Chitinophaga qingshengii]|uniref:Thioredoxin family protein n=1 Tax=Chitinophaga qingshengii TaxID=1569794 RepID=A0ABR7TUL5_9BACT|nr:thioredoxin family protein [Chitinophaga qingshengii]MBC9934176.1 thioredoxin family protein [Chitinophaga qingshengii]
MSQQPAILLQFFATWCGPCKMLMPIVDSVATKMKDQLEVSRIDIDQEEELSGRFRIMAVPTLVLMKDNQEIWRQTGLLPESHLKTALEIALSGK